MWSSGSRSVHIYLARNTRAMHCGGGNSLNDNVLYVHTNDNTPSFLTESLGATITVCCSFIVLILYYHKHHHRINLSSRAPTKNNK